MRRNFSDAIGVFGVASGVGSRARLLREASAVVVAEFAAAAVVVI